MKRTLRSHGHSSKHHSMFETLEQRRMLSASTYIALLDGTQNFGSTQRAVSFYDVSDLSSTNVLNQDPLFSIWTGYEGFDILKGGNYEDPGAITVDPSTGTVYMLAFDSGSPGVVDSGGDTEGDYDLYKLDFQLALADFTANDRARGTMYAPTKSLYLPAVASNDNPQHPSHNGTTINLDGVSQKIGEIARAQSGESFDYAIEFVSQDKLVLLDNQTGLDTEGDIPANDHQIRLIQRVSTEPGFATYDAVNNEGGFNGRNQTESWVSTIASLVNMDFDESGNPVGRSEPTDMAYVNRGGVEGVWVGESDGGGDDVGFFEIQWGQGAWNPISHSFVTPGNAELRPFDVGVGPDFPTSFSLDDDPTVSVTTNDGRIDWINLDADGNLQIGESGFYDTPQAEPKVISREVQSYNQFSRIDFGAWTTSNKLPQPTNDDDADVTDGRFVAYDKNTGLVWYFDPDSAAYEGDPNVVSDVYVFDPATNTVVYEELNAANHFLEKQGIAIFTLNEENLAATIVGRHIFYNRSAFDGNNAAANASDDGAIAPDKTALLPGQTATFANYTSYSRGINGIMIDIAGLPDTGLSTSDFIFNIGNTNTASSWSIAPNPTSITIRNGAGVGGSDRVTFIWADNAIQKQWLEVTVLANTNTGLEAADVFYFGNAIGDTGNSTANAAVNSADELNARANPRNALSNPAGITDLHDFNRDKSVNATDQLLARSNGTNPLTTALKLIVPAESLHQSFAVQPLGRGFASQSGSDLFSWTSIEADNEETFAALFA